MKSKSVIFLVGLVVVSPVFAERQPYDRYQSIVDRQMFGPLPPGFDPTKAPSEVQKSSVSEKQLTQEEEKLKSSIHFSMINVTPDGATAVGFTDKSDPKVPVNYYLKVGEKRNGWEVKEADAAAATMTIAKGEIQVSLKIGGDSTKDANATTKAGGAAMSAARGPSTARGSGLLSGGSLRARRRLREQEAQQAQAKKDEAAAAAAAEREAQRQAQAEAERAQREAERAEQRQQLQAIQEELKRAREEKTKAAAEANSEEKNDNDAT